MLASSHFECDLLLNVRRKIPEPSCVVEQQCCTESRDRLRPMFVLQLLIPHRCRHIARCFFAVLIVATGGMMIVPRSPVAQDLNSVKFAQDIHIFAMCFLDSGV